MKPLLIYCSGPYSADATAKVWDNVYKAIRAGIEIRKKGHYPVIPHLYNDFDIVSKDLGITFSWQDYMDMDLAILEGCNAFFFIGPSKGALIELEKAKELGLKIFYSLDEVPKVVVSI